MPRAACFAFCLATVSCGQPPAEPGGSGGAGDAGVEVRAGWYRSFDEPIVLLEGGGSLPLRMAPQGGHRAFVSARVRGIEATEMSVGVQLFDSGTGELLFAERAGGALKVSPNDPSAVEPELDLRGAIVHVPVCPLEAPPHLFGSSLRLRVEVAGSRLGAAELGVTPDCSAGTPGERELCECECQPDYDPGKCY
ncbi:MAG: hypothetical protein IT377_10600 [Polyangiaceae bacterium]|nr:hypothetical protein [Polyangiaceae bacterium]